MNSDTIVYCVVALLLGMLLANMLKNVCGCKTVEGSNHESTNSGIVCTDLDASCLKKMPACNDITDGYVIDVTMNNKIQSYRCNGTWKKV